MGAGALVERSIMKGKGILLAVVVVLLAWSLQDRPAESAGEKSTGGRSVEPKVVLVVHGGAGVIPKKELTEEREKLLRADMEKALRAGYKALQAEKGTSLDAVEAAIKVLEDSPRFNAGKGAVFTHDGRNELDASIMEGKEKRAGAVAGITCIKNPISAARAVMENSNHVMLSGRGADLFATQQGLEVVDPSYYWTRERWLQLKDALREEEEAKKGGKRGSLTPAQRHLGTVGAVALDRHGNLAAGTSTGGMTNKRYNRIGDSPIIGAGTYADNSACAVSCTGHGEIFIRYSVAHDVASRMIYGKQSVREAARQVIARLPKEPGGVGGLIALDARGNAAMSFDTEGMHRGTVTGDGKIQVAIYDK
jgi:beta-aspartyl-peptidase (threonine type)